MRTARSNSASFTRLGNQWVHQTVEGERREKALAATGVAVWPMTDLEADDGLASAAHIASGNEDVEKVCITSQLDRDTLVATLVSGENIG